MAEILFKVPGKIRDTAEKDPDASRVHPFPQPKSEKAIDIAVAARGTSDKLEPLDLKVDPDNTVIELEFEGGIRQFVHPAQLSEDLRRTQVSRGGDPDVVTIPTEFGPATTRGVGDLLLKGMKLLGVDPVSAVSELAVRKVISSFEDKLSPAPGLYRIKDPNNVSELITDTKQLDASSPYLVFVHGTASSISGSFGGLGPVDGGTPPPDWTKLADKYQNRVLALQHKTFSESPVKNAIDVASLLPQGARLHLVSHSRGGLVGELLCITELEDWHFKAFEAAAQDRLEDVNDEPTRQRILDQRKEEIASIKKLADVIKQKRFSIDKFVRVVCPARGTILLSHRLDLYLSVLLNVIGFIQVLKSSMAYDFVKATVLEVAKRRTDPRELPGIEAMMPESPLIHILNQPALRAGADLAVISGDLAPDQIWKKLALLAVQVLYLQDNDLVVNTMSMYGGMQRASNASYFFNKGPHVNHFHYFRNPGTQGRLRDWLLSAAGTKVEGFNEFKPDQKDFQADTRRGLDDTRPVLFLIPDQLGSQLRRDKPVLSIGLSRISATTG